jgi:hypothetical protein
VGWWRQTVTGEREKVKAKDMMIVAGAALAVWALLKFAGGGSASAPQYWVTEQGNTGFPETAKTGGAVWI